MSEFLPPSTAIAIATVTTPKPKCAGDGEDRHLIAAALFNVDQSGPAEFHYRLAVRTIDPGDSEAELIEWLTEELPSDRTFIGWRFAEEIVRPLLSASNAVSPEQDAAFIDALVAAVNMDSIDLADDDSARSLSFEALCTGHGIPTRSMSNGALLAAWGIGRRGELVATLAINVVASWRAWAATRFPSADLNQRFAEAALLRWRADDEATHSWRDETGAQS